MDSLSMSKNGFIIVVDDQRDHADGLVEALGRLGEVVIAAYTGHEAMELVRSQRVDVVIADMNPGGDIGGIELLDEVRKTTPHTEVIILTASPTIETCKDALRHNAFDYLAKPVDTGELLDTVRKASEKARSAYAGSTRPARIERRGFAFEGILGANPMMQAIYQVLRRVSPTTINVLIEGESGTGKELLARAIHLNSPRRTAPFIPINCAGLSETLLESELFGHVKGAFTGAASDRKGLFEVADKGTLFLDEIGDMPMFMQAKLLRVLEDGVIVPVGSTNRVKVDVRVISATNHDLIHLIEEKKFRQDLYFRIKGVSITVPPLRARREDIPVLIASFLEEACDQLGLPQLSISAPAMTALLSYDWPGNIRQLRNAVRTMSVMCEGDMIELRDIPLELRPVRRLAGSAQGPEAMTLGDLEKNAIAETLSKVEGNREKAAKILGIGERTLYRKIKEYNL
jgi:DNA-binding NtrC family response regulator